MIQIILGGVFWKICLFQNRAGGSQGHYVMILRPGRKGCSTAFGRPGSRSRASAGELCVRSGGAASWAQLVLSWIWFCSQKLNPFWKICLCSLPVGPMLARPSPEKKTQTELLERQHSQDAVRGLNPGCSRYRRFPGSLLCGPISTGTWLLDIGFGWGGKHFPIESLKKSVAHFFGFASVGEEK